MRILVMGAGALGTVAGGFMARAGHDVILIGRNPHMDAITTSGLTIEGIWGTHHIDSLKCYVTPELVTENEFDFALIAVKSYDTTPAVRSILPLLSANTHVCSYQNGLGNAEKIATEVGWERVLGARVIYGAKIVAPAKVVVTVIAAPTAIGAYRNGGATEEAARVLADAMQQAQLPTVKTDAIASLLWNKVAYNCALNPLSALLNVPYGVLGKNPYTREIMQEVIHELYAVASAMGITMNPPTAASYLDSFYRELLPPTAAHYASMREDLLQGRRTEIDALNGAIVTFGEERHIPCPTNKLLTELVHAREAIAKLAQE